MAQNYYNLKNFLRTRFACDIRKLPVHTYLGCPHRIADGGGCIYCNESGFSAIHRQEKRIRNQMIQGISDSRMRGFKGKFIAYFQTGTNTCAEPDLLESWWCTVLEFPVDIVGLSVSTRPDCLEVTHLGILERLANHLMVWVELGLQSANDDTLKRINRGHDFASFEEAVGRIRRFPELQSIAHIILGLPGETVDDMRTTIGELNRLSVDGVKIHHLQVVQNTVLAEWHREGRVRVFDEEEYIRLLVELIPYINERMIIHRLVGDIHPDLLIAPKWEKTKTQILQEVDSRLLQAGLKQGVRSGDQESEFGGC